MHYVNLIVDHKSRHTDEYFTYASEEPLAVGTVVTVTFGKGKKELRGFVFETEVQTDLAPGRIKKILRVDDRYALTEENIRTIIWMRQRYGIQYLDGIRCFLPAGRPPRPGKEKEPYQNVKPDVQDIQALTEEQQTALDKLTQAADQGRYRAFLLHGVTGSGKTEVYMQAIAHVLEQGRQAVMLVPEIALTKQIIERFAGRFGKKELAVLHSRLTMRERYDEWMRISRGEARIVIGARIGVFAPLKDIGILIMDEEHEATYKSDQTPKYETVDIAAKRMMDMGGMVSSMFTLSGRISFPRYLAATAAVTPPQTMCLPSRPKKREQAFSSSRGLDGGPNMMLA